MTKRSIAVMVVIETNDPLLDPDNLDVRTAAAIATSCCAIRPGTPEGDLLGSPAQFSKWRVVANRQVLGHDLYRRQGVGAAASGVMQFAAMYVMG